MNYVLWAIVAMVSYSFAFLFIKVALRGLPTFTALPISIVTLMVTATALSTVFGEWRIPEHTTRHVGFAFVGGLFLASAVLGYFQALSAGPVSIVVPIFGMFLVGGATLGIVFLGEPLTAKKALGIAFGAMAVVLIAT